VPSLHKLYSKKQIDQMRQELINKHGNFCGVCGKPRSHFKKQLSVDHRHSDGLIRGLACFRCNKFLIGRFTLRTIIPVVLYLIKYELTGELWQKYGKISQDLKDLTKFLT
jgi:Recombination endonuclease VII